MTSSTIYNHPDITKNKYFKLYTSLIVSPDIAEYTELHHILPKSMGGDNESKNLVRLSARKHFLCHYLLTKFTTGASNYKMLVAFVGMKREPNQIESRRYVNSRLYEHARHIFSKSQQLLQKQRWAAKTALYGKYTHIHNDGVRKVIPSTQLQQYQELGWVMGRYPKKSNTTPAKGQGHRQFFPTAGKPTTTRMTIINLAIGQIIHIQSWLIYEYLASGWQLQFLPEKKRGTIAIHNGEMNANIMPEHIDIFKQAGWVTGRLNANRECRTIDNCKQGAVSSLK